MVQISQDESDETCPGAEITAFVSVLDQWRFPVKNLTENDFEIFENGDDKDITNFFFVLPGISVALVLDYSGSIIDKQEIINDMESAAVEFVDQLRIVDEAEIIKFATEIKVMQEFTSDRALLESAIKKEPGADIGRWTALYDAVSIAVEETEKFGTKDRKAVILLTDGRDVGDDEGNPGSDKDVNDVIQEAKDYGIPIFTIGLGDNVRKPPLIRMADETGGLFFESPTSDNLETIYQQLADLLFENQYIVEYDSGLARDETGNLKIKVSYPPFPEPTTISSEDTREITPCPIP